MSENRLPPIPVPQRLTVGLLLAFTGGFLDVYTYILRGGVFANAQTGNLVLMGIRLAKFDWIGALYYVVPILAFCMGAYTAGAVRRKINNRGNIHWRQFIVLLELLLLAIVGFVPSAVHPELVNITVSFICAVQVSSFRYLEGLPYASTMCTGNLRSATENFRLFITDKDRDALQRALRYVEIIGIFLFGAMAAVWLINIFAEGAIWFCCGVLGAVLAFLIIVQDEMERKSGEPRGTSTR